jgi:hypothetical protein
MRPTLLSAALVAALPVTPLAAQVATVDEGSFSITRNGAPAGREEFSIRRTPSGAEGGAVYVASATIAYDGRRLSPALRADASGSPLAYQVEVKVGSEVQERLTGQVGRGRFSALTKTPRGESAKEYVVSDGALVLDDDVFHQYFFVARNVRGGGATIPVVVPRRNAQLSMRVEDRGSESVTVGGRALDARHLVLREGTTAGTERDVWVDAQGRVLKVSIASRGIVAVRDEPPR